MRILFINNDGGGFADHIEFEEKRTVAEFFVRYMHDGDPVDFAIWVNRQNVASDYILQDGDRVTITPKKIRGGCR